MDFAAMKSRHIKLGNANHTAYRIDPKNHPRTALKVPNYAFYIPLRLRMMQPAFPMPQYGSPTFLSGKTSSGTYYVLRHLCRSSRVSKSKSREPLNSKSSKLMQYDIIMKRSHLCGGSVM